jgi:hypothetical protein
MGAAAAAQPSEAQVRKLLETIGVGKMLSQMNTQMAGVMRQSLPCVPAGYWQGFVDASATDQLIGTMVPVYQKHFTAEDIEGLQKFYASPLGQKVITEMPVTLAEGTQAGRQWGQQRGAQMIAALKQKGTLDASGKCPATATASAGPAIAAAGTAPAPASSAAGASDEEAPVAAPARHHKGKAAAHAKGKAKARAAARTTGKAKPAAKQAAKPAAKAAAKPRKAAKAAPVPAAQAGQ